MTSRRSQPISWNSVLLRSSEYLLTDEFKQRVMEEDNTMVHMIPTLSQMNRLGYLTVDSQEGKIEHFRKNGIPYTKKQRSYVAGLMDITLARRFIHIMNLETDMCAINIPIVCDGCDIRLPPDLDIPLTTSHAKNKHPKVETHMSTAIPYNEVVNSSGKLFSDIYSKFKCKQFLETKKLYYVFCWDPKWARNILFTKILKFLKH